MNSFYLHNPRPPGHAGWLALILGLLLPLASAQAQSAPSLLVLHNSFVSAEKFALLQPFADAAGIELHHLDPEQSDAQTLSDALAATQLLVLDVPRPNDRASVQSYLPDDLGLPRLTLGGGRPEWHQLPPALGAQLSRLYAAGGEPNFRRFFALAHDLLTRQTPSAGLLEPPQQLPAAGFYHPRTETRFTTLDAYLAWYRQQYPDTPATAGKIGFLIHPSSIANLLTREIDELITRSTAAGLVPVVFWFDNADANGLPGIVGPDRLDALVNLTHLQQGEARLRDFETLDIPVLQTLRFREGETADWDAAPSGVSSRITALFLALPEVWGLSDPLVLSASQAGVESLLPEQADALIAKLQHLAALRHTAPADKRLALMFWNYPAGEQNLSASHLNLPRSILSIQQALESAGYRVGNLQQGAADAEQQVIAQAQRMLGALYGSESLEQLLQDNLAALYPLADYQRWLDSLPAARRQQLLALGNPAGHWAVREYQGQTGFVIPRWQLGQLTVLPQMPRHSAAKAHSGHYHDTHSAPDHLYLAAYLYLQQQQAVHALIHLGTHGTQEWLPGKDRGLAASDYPWLAVGALPVFYPYLQDNVGEALQAKRRGRAVIISHQTPPFAPAGLYDQLRDLHQALHEYQQLDEGQVRDQVSQQIRESVIAAGLHTDLGWSEQQLVQNFTQFLPPLHDQLHELSRTAMPLGLHTFGQAAAPEHRIVTLMQQLGEPFYQALAQHTATDSSEWFAADTQDLTASPPFLQLQQWLNDPDSVKTAAPSLAAFAQRALQLEQQLHDSQENEALLAGLAGRFVSPGAGGDPIRNPDLRSGRNLYAFEADKLPTEAAYRAASTAYAQLRQAYREAHDGAEPGKLAFSLWSSEAIRHLGVSEGQILHALGLRPVWDAGGRVRALEIIPAAELGRPRVDVVVQVTSVYRDQFDAFMRLLAQAIERLSELDEPGNAVAANSRRIAAELQAQGMDAATAQRNARYRIFSNAPGEYGTDLPERLLQSTQWEDEQVLAGQFLARSRYAYGSDHWGQTPTGVNLLAQQLRGTQAAILARSSQLHGVLSTDHPFEYLGGLAAAIRSLDGETPQLLVSDLRDSQMRTVGLERFLANELRSRYLNPQWIAAMQQEGYAGTLEVIKVTNNLFGWQVTAPDSVRDDQWQALFETYIDDNRELGTRDWFEQHNPSAEAQILERMAEAIRKDYWQASEQTRQALVQRWQTLEQRGLTAGTAATTQAFIATLAQGFGLQPGPAPEQAPASAQATENPATTSTQQPVQGQVLQPVASTEPELWSERWLLLAMLLLVMGGALQQQRRNRTHAL